MYKDDVLIHVPVLRNKQILIDTKEWCIAIPCGMEKNFVFLWKVMCEWWGGWDEEGFKEQIDNAFDLANKELNFAAKEDDVIVPYAPKPPIDEVKENCTSTCGKKEEAVKKQIILWITSSKKNRRI